MESCESNSVSLLSFLFSGSMTTSTAVDRWQQIGSVLSRFDFEKVRKMMLAVDWKWGGPYMNGEFDTPTIDAMESQCTQLMLECYRLEAKVSAGGFEAIWVPATQRVVLQFVAAVCY